METNEDILDAPAGQPQAVRRTFTFIGLLGATLLVISVLLIGYYMSIANFRFEGLSFLNVPDWVLISFLLSIVVLLTGLIGSYVRKEPGGTLRWIILVAGGGALILVVTLLSS